MNMNKLYTMILVVVTMLFSPISFAADKSGESTAKQEVVVKGDGKVKYVEANGRKLECLVVKTSLFRQQVSCEETAKVLNPQTGQRDGNWHERRLGLSESTTTAGDIAPVLVGGVLSPLISYKAAVNAAKELHCGAECGTVINNHNSNTNTATNAPVTSLDIENNLDARIPCTGSCPP